MTMRGNWTMKTVLGVNNLSVIVDAHLKSDHVYNLHLF